MDRNNLSHAGTIDTEITRQNQGDRFHDGEMEAGQPGSFLPGCSAPTDSS